MSNRVLLGETGYVESLVLLPRPRPGVTRKKSPEMRSTETRIKGSPVKILECPWRFGSGRDFFYFFIMVTRFVTMLRSRTQSSGVIEL